MGFTVFKEIILRDYYLSRRGLEKFSNAFDVPERKHNLRLPCEEGPLFCYSEPWPLIVVVGTKGEEGNIFLKKRQGRGSASYQERPEFCITVTRVN